MSERSAALRGLWAEVNRLLEAEDTVTIRRLLGEAGIQPEMHVGRIPEEFTTDMHAEWALGGIADVIDSGRIELFNTMRNVSFSQFEKAYGVAS